MKDELEDRGKKVVHYYNKTMETPCTDWCKYKRQK